MPQSDSNQPSFTLIPASEQKLFLRVDEQIHQEAREYLRAGRQGSVNSHRAFLTDLKSYSAWCEENGYEPTPLSPVALVEYVTFLGRTRSFFTIQRHLASIAKLHRQHRADSPTT
ncbi:site-specific integrase, partial [Spirosoma pulveris]